MKVSTNKILELEAIKSHEVWILKNNYQTVDAETTRIKIKRSKGENVWLVA